MEVNNIQGNVGRSNFYGKFSLRKILDSINFERYIPNINNQVGFYMSNLLITYLFKLIYLNVNVNSFTKR